MVPQSYDAASAIQIKLKAGMNTVLVKTQGGGGGSSFTFEITDPGDLKAQPKP